MHANQALKMMTKGEILAALPQLAANERSQLVMLLDYLGELGERRGHKEAGYASLWDYARRCLHFSEMQATLRTKAARALQRRPELRRMLVDGRLNLCTLAALEPLLDQAGADVLVAEAAFQTKRAVQDLVAARGGSAAPTRDVIRRVGAESQAAKSGAPRLPLDLLASPAGAAPGQEAPPVTRDLGSSCGTSHIDVPPVEEAQPQPAKSYRVSFSARQTVADKLRRLEELLGTTCLDEVVDKAADALLDKVDPARRHARRLRRQETKRQAETGPAPTPAASAPTPAAPAAPSAAPPPAAPTPPLSPSSALPPAAATRAHPQRSRRPPAAVADQVKVRDRLQCSYVARDGTGCAERRWVQIDHIRPFALGGGSTDPEQLRNLCFAHNQMMARRTFPGQVPERTQAR